MELDQMIGVVRHLIAQNQGLVHMDEMLTAVQGAEQRMREANAAVAAQDELLKSKEQLLSNLTLEGQKKASELEVQLADIRASNQLKYDAIIEEHEARRQSLEGALQSLDNQVLNARTRLQGFQKDIEQYTARQQAAIAEYERIKQAINALTASIKV